jgi:hypothetical protein
MPIVCSSDETGTSSISSNHLNKSMANSWAHRTFQPKNTYSLQKSARASADTLEKNRRLLPTAYFFLKLIV